eukprot:14036909-Alexandrium_andersonii.AAC.1
MAIQARLFGGAGDNSESDEEGVPQDAFEDPDVATDEHRRVHAVVNEALSNDTVMSAIAANIGEATHVDTYDTIAQAALDVDLQ